MGVAGGRPLRRALAAAFLFVSVDASLPVRQADAILVEFEEPKVPDPPVPSRPAVVEPEHTQIDDEESFDQAKGSDEATRTVNPKALFKMAKDGPDEPEDTGNPKAPEGRRTRLPEPVRGSMR